MQIYVKASGPTTARIMLVGEAPGEQEVAEGKPFVGAVGHLMTGMLHDAGIQRTDCYITNVCRFRPPGNNIEAFIIDPKRMKKSSPVPSDFIQYNGWFVAPFVVKHIEDLKREILEVKPNVIVAFGATALWALTGLRGISDWNGTVNPCTLVEGFKVVPCYHPAAVLRVYEWRWESVQYLRTAKRESDKREITNLPYVHHVRPTFRHAMEFLEEVDRVENSSVDIETRHGHIACIGFSISKLEAMCIPLMCVERAAGYFSPEEEVQLIYRMNQILSRPFFTGQNFLYDAQYLAKYFGVFAAPRVDTMVAQHVAFPSGGTASGRKKFATGRKALDFLVKMYAEQPRFWKNESKEWDPKVGEAQLWGYNCKDCCYTHEVGEVLEGIIDRLKLKPQFDLMMAKFPAALDRMIRGFKIDLEKRERFSTDLKAAFDERLRRLEYCFGHPVNPRSIKLKDLFYRDFAIPPVLSRKKANAGKETIDDEALEKIKIREPLLIPACEWIQQARTLGIYRSTFVEAELDQGRMHCSFNIAGPITFRESSSEDAFGFGTNLQNVPKYDEEEEELKDPDNRLPDVRTLFVPDEGMICFDADLESADMHVVAWEADDSKLKQMLREGIKIAKVNAKLLGCSYHLAKVGGHGTNYGGKAATMAANCGVTVHEMDKFQRRYFAEYPGILAWHKRVERQAMSTRCVYNQFGYRRFIFERLEGLLPELLAWIPQSTVAIVISLGEIRIRRELPEAEILLQVHDSLVGQLPEDRVHELAPRVSDLMRVTVPYPDPLVIPASIKLSRNSWGQCGDFELGEVIK